MKKSSDFNKDFSEVQLREIFSEFGLSKNEIEKAIQRYFEVRKEELKSLEKLINKKGSQQNLSKKDFVDIENASLNYVNNDMRDGEEIIYQIAEEIKQNR